jgi:hypothetical protein
MPDRSDDDSLSRLRPLNRVEDPVAAHSAGPEAPKSPSQFLADVLGAGFEEGEGFNDRILDRSRESGKILLRPVGEEQPRQGRDLA